MDFDPERFEAEKYDTYFADLQTAYRQAFERMNEEFDSTLVHAIDQRVLAESEPVYDADAVDASGGFAIVLPEEPPPRERVSAAGVLVDDRFEAVLDRYVTELEAALERVLLDESAGTSA